MYMIYTSDSTGKPKGVLTSLQIKKQSTRFLQTISIYFGPSVYGVFAPLIRGATIILGQPQQISQGKDLYVEIITYSITIMTFVPTILKYLLNKNYKFYYIEQTK